VSRQIFEIGIFLLLHTIFFIVKKSDGEIRKFVSQKMDRKTEKIGWT
jgi:hypothetical protein